jgi:hypothetical protein
LNTLEHLLTNQHPIHLFNFLPHQREKLLTSSPPFNRKTIPANFVSRNYIALSPSAQKRTKSLHFIRVNHHFIIRHISRPNAITHVFLFYFIVIESLQGKQQQQQQQMR